MSSMVDFARKRRQFTSLRSLQKREEKGDRPSHRLTASEVFRGGDIVFNRI